MAKNNLVDVIRILGRFKQLQMILTEGQAGQDARWTALQEWLDNNTDYKARIDHCLSISPGEAVNYLCDEFGIDLSVMSAFDANGAIRAAAIQAIAVLQQLYKERKGINETTEPHRIAASNPSADHADGPHRKPTDRARQPRTRHRE